MVQGALKHDTVLHPLTFFPIPVQEPVPLTQEILSAAASIMAVAIANVPCTITRCHTSSVKYD